MCTSLEREPFEVSRIEVLRKTLVAIPVRLSPWTSGSGERKGGLRCGTVLVGKPCLE